MHRLLNTLTLLLLATLTLPDYALARNEPAAAHVARHRMIKIRRQDNKNSDSNGGGVLGGVLGGGAGNVAQAPNNTAATSTGAAATGTAATQPPTGGNAANGNGNGAAGGANGNGATATTGTATANAPGTTPTQGNGGILGSIINPIIGGLDGNGGANSTATNSSSSSSSSSSSTTTTASTASVTQPPSTAPPPLIPASTTSSPSASTGIVTVTTTGSSIPTPSDADNVKKSSPGITTIGKNTIIILAAIAGSIGVAGIIWTIIRKWKFRPSRSFEDRIQPIDWQPTSNDHDSMRERDITDRALERTGSRRSHGSFISAEGHGNNGDYLTADLPNHDFTAGPSHLAPVGAYADLQRGPSPQPGGYPNMRAPSPYQYEIPNTYAPVQPQQQPYYGYDQRGY